jgi:hypothetical protein
MFLPRRWHQTSLVSPPLEIQMESRFRCAQASHLYYTSTRHLKGHRVRCERHEEASLLHLREERRRILCRVGLPKLRRCKLFEPH